MAKTIRYGILVQLKSAGRNVAARLEKTLERIADKTRRLSQLSQRLLLGVAGAIAGIGYAAGQQEAADRKLASTLKSLGDASQETYQGMKRLAAGVQDVSTFGDEQVQTLIAQALNLGITSDRMDEAVKGAIGLSEAFSIDLNSAMKMTALALQGDYTLLQRYVTALKTAETEAEKQAIVQRAMAAGWEQAKDAAEDLQGMVGQIKNRLGDLLQAVGSQILGTDTWADSLKRVHEKIKWLVGKVQDLTTEQVEQIRKWAKVTLAVVGFTAVLSPLSRALAGIVGGARGAGRALKFMCAHPVLLAITAATTAAYGLRRALNKGIDATVKVTRAARDAYTAEKELRQETAELWWEFKTLAEKGDLSNAEFVRAKELLGKIEGKYGDLGVEVNDTARSFGNLEAAQKSASEAMQTAAILRLGGALAEAQAEHAKWARKRRALLHDVAYGSMFGLLGAKKMDELIAESEDATKYMSAAVQEVMALKTELRALKAGDWEGLAAGKEAGEAAARGLKDAGDALEDAGREGGERAGRAAAEGFRLGFVSPLAGALNWLKGALEDIAEKWSKEVAPAISPAAILGRRIERKERTLRHLQRIGPGEDAARVARLLYELREAQRVMAQSGLGPSEQAMMLTHRQRQQMHGINVEPDRQRRLEQERLRRPQQGINQPEQQQLLRGINEQQRALDETAEATGVLADGVDRLTEGIGGFAEHVMQRYSTMQAQLNHMADMLHHLTHVRGR